jgi:epsin
VRRGGFEEYNAGDDEVASPSRRSTSGGVTSPSHSSAAAKKEPVKEVDLLGGFDEEVDAFGGSTDGGASLATEKALPSLSGLSAGAEADDDFADFQAAPSALPSATTTTSNPATKPNLMEMLNSPLAATAARPVMGLTSTSSFSQASIQSPMGFTNNTNTLGMMSRPAPAAPVQNTLFSQPSPSPSLPPGRPNPSSATTNAAGAKSSGNFDDLWTMSLGSSAKQTATGTKSIKDLEKEKAAAGIWGAGQKKPAQGQFGDFGNFGGSGSGAGGNATTTTTGGGGGDDLLL